MQINFIKSVGKYSRGKYFSCVFELIERMNLEFKSFFLTIYRKFLKAFNSMNFELHLKNVQMLLAE